VERNVSSQPSPEENTPTPLNRLRLSAVLSAINPLRFTPAGIDVLELVVQHQSVQHQSATGSPRQVELTLKAVAYADDARLLSRTALGSLLELEGFLLNATGRSKQPQLQIERCKVAKPPTA
jgi:primosomal replication protein N